MGDVIDLEPGHAGKSELLIQAIIEVIMLERFGDMTVAEVIGSLELVKARLIKA